LTPISTSENIVVTMTEKRLGAMVRRLRRQHDLTQAQLARRVALARGHVSEIETGVCTHPSAVVIKKRARALGVPVTEPLE
jgi:transcriptional regulator with XRE-family HTH domain